MIGWIKNVINTIVINTILPQTLGQGAQAIDRKSKARLQEEDENPLDDAEVQETREKSSKLLGGIRRPGQTLNSLKLRINARKKVKKNLSPFYDIDGIPEEVTEKLIEAAQEDPFYKKWFR